MRLDKMDICVVDVMVEFEQLGRGNKDAHASCPYIPPIPSILSNTKKPWHSFYSHVVVHPLTHTPTSRPDFISTRSICSLLFGSSQIMQNKFEHSRKIINPKQNKKTARWIAGSVCSPKQNENGPGTEKRTKTKLSK